MFVRGCRVALACALSALGLAACSSGDKPVALPSLSQSPAASPTPSPTDSAAIKQAVTAIVTRYYALLNAPTTVANGQSLSALMTSTCTCRRVATSTIDVARKHQSYFGRTTVVSVTPVVDGPSLADALVEYDYDASGIKDAQGHIVTRTAGRKGSKLLFYFKLAGGSWLISEVRSISNGTPA